MKAPISFELAEQKLWLTALRAVYWEEMSALIVSDLHFGKTGHFRKAGIAVPQNVYKQDLQRLFALVQHFQPRELIIVGDFFHSVQNKELDWFARWRSDHSALQITLVRGNHDILHRSWYHDQNVEVVQDVYEKGPFIFVHEWDESKHISTGKYCFTGHIHPGILIKGAGRQSLRFPCFYFGKQFAVLPAFGDFTGLALMQPAPGDAVFLIVHQQIMRYQ